MTVATRTAILGGVSGWLEATETIAMPSGSVTTGEKLPTTRPARGAHYRMIPDARPPLVMVGASLRYYTVEVINWRRAKESKTMWMLARDVAADQEVLLDDFRAGGPDTVEIAVAGLVQTESILVSRDDNPSEDGEIQAVTHIIFEVFESNAQLS